MRPGIRVGASLPRGVIDDPAFGHCPCHVYCYLCRLAVDCFTVFHRVTKPRRQRTLAAWSSGGTSVSKESWESDGVTDGVL